MSRIGSQTHTKWQSQKSALTRDRIVIATLECIVECGYHKTTMATIARMAEVSQGCMQYHFPAKLDAIKAAINYLYAKRLTDHKRDLENIPQGADRMAHSIDVYWHHLNEDHFTAYQELVIAGRTDKELSKLLKQGYRRFVKAWRQDAVDLILDRNGDRERYELICDIGQYQMEGLVFGRLNDQISDEQARKVLSFTKDLLVKMVSGLEVQAPG